MLRRLLCGLSCRDYRAAAEAVPEAFGLSRSSVSRRYIRATARKLQALQERRLEPYDLVTLVLDGKAFADDVMVIALGITLASSRVAATAHMSSHLDCLMSHTSQGGLQR